MSEENCEFPSLRYYGLDISELLKNKKQDLYVAKKGNAVCARKMPRNAYYARQNIVKYP